MGAIAAGKVNASEATEGMRIIVKVSYDAEGHATVSPSRTKTGEGVFVARIIEKGFRAAGRYEARGKYVIHTSAGSFDAAPIQTMFLAPEDTAGIKRAMVEAQAEDEARTAAAELAAAQEVAPTERAATYNAATGTEDAAAEHEVTTIECENEWHRTAPVRALILCPECPVELPSSPDTECPLCGGPLASDGVCADDECGADQDDETSQAEDLTLNSHDGKVDHMNNDANTETEFQPADVEAPAKVRELTGSAVVRLMERVHERIRQNHPSVPAVVIVTGAGIGMFGGKWGHFRPQGWTAKAAEEGGAATHIHEMFMAGETLAKGARQVLQTMLHESAHAECEATGVQDTSRQGRWHNKAFLAKAQELGLEYKKDKANPQIGYSEVTLTEATVAEYADLLDELDREIDLMVRLPGWLATTGGDDEDGEDKGGENMGKAPKTGPATPNTNNVKCVCECPEPNIIRMSRKVLDKALIRCDECESLFSAA